MWVSQYFGLHTWWKDSAGMFCRIHSALASTSPNPPRRPYPCDIDTISHMSRLSMPNITCLLIYCSRL